MPPINSISPVPNPASVLSNRPLLARSLSPQSQLRQGFFGTLLNAISSLANVLGVMKNINGIWRFIHPIHIENTQAAQEEIDIEYLTHHMTEWQDKNRRAENRALTQMMAITAVERPDRFVKQHILDKEEGSRERKVITGLLKVLNPEYYEENQDVLGEAEDLDEYNIFSEVPEVDEDANQDGIPQ
jgi:hypothetical protein